MFNCSLCNCDVLVKLFSCTVMPIFLVAFFNRTTASPGIQAKIDH